MPHKRRGELEAADWLWLGHCRICGTSVQADDEFLRTPAGAVHFECAVYRVPPLGRVDGETESDTPVARPPGSD